MNVAVLDPSFEFQRDNYVTARVMRCARLSCALEGGQSVDLEFEQNKTLVHGGVAFSHGVKSHYKVNYREDFSVDSPMTSFCFSKKAKYLLWIKWLLTKNTNDSSMTENKGKENSEKAKTSHINNKTLGTSA